MTHCRKGDLKNISFGFTSERYYKKARAQTKLGEKKKKISLKCRENVFE